MRKSIIQDDLSRCIVCDRRAVHKHHVVFGSNHKQSDKYKLLVGLCLEHHMGTYGVHGKNGNELNRKLQKKAQKAFEREYSHEEWMKVFGRNYL